MAGTPSPGDETDLLAVWTGHTTVGAVERQTDPLPTSADRPREGGYDSPCHEPKRLSKVDSMTNVTLNNGVEMPALGLGVFQTPPEETRAAVEAALATGYRHIDTAAAYGNEREVGEAIRRSGHRPRRGLPRDQDLDQRLRLRRDAARVRQERRQARRRPDRPADPAPGAARRSSTGPWRRTGRWRRCSPTARSAPSASATSWSTTSPRCWTKATVVPAVNQIEVHPYFQQREVQAFGAEHGILTQAWSPDRRHHLLPRRQHTAAPCEDPVIGEIAQAHGKTPGAGDAALAPAAGPLGHPEVDQAAAHRRELRRLRLRSHRRRSSPRSTASTPDQRGGPEPEDITLRELRPADPRSLTRTAPTPTTTEENHHARTHTRHARPAGVRPRPRLHGHEPVVRSTTTTRRDDHVPPCRGGPGRHPVRHRRGLRPLPQRGAGRRGAATGPRGRRHRHQVRVRLRRERQADRRHQQAGRHPRRRRGLAASPADRRHRPALPAPRRPGRPHRGRRRHRQGADRGRQGPPLRDVRGRRRTRSAAPTRCSPSRRCRASTPCSGASPRTRSCPPSRSSASASCRSARSGAGS